jgi:hypothetical protein
VRPPATVAPGPLVPSPAGLRDGGVAVRTLPSVPTTLSPSFVSDQPELPGLRRRSPVSVEGPGAAPSEVDEPLLGRAERRAYAQQSRRTMSWLHSNSVRESGRWCERAPQGGPDGLVVIEANDAGDARARGLQTCSSPWSCPRCASVIRRHRARGLEAIVAERLDAGQRVLFCTATLPHRAGEWLTERGIPDSAGFFDTVQQAWARLTSGRWWQQFKLDLGLHGMYRASEATWNFSQRLPHAHLHWLMFVDDDSSDDEIAVLMARLRARWLRIVKALCPIDPEDTARWRAVEEHAFDWDHAERTKIGAYLVKMGHGVGTELVARGKASKGQNMSVWELLDGAVAGRRGYTAAFNAWERASEGHLMLTASGDVPTVSQVEENGKHAEALQPEPNQRPWRSLVVLHGRDWVHLIECCGSTAAVLDRAASAPDGFEAWCQRELAVHDSAPLPTWSAPRWLDPF